MLHKFLRTIRANSQDPYFKQVSLLLHGDGTNGSQNNTFIDSSTNNFSITRNGNTTQGTFSPFSQDAGYWSNFFDGSGDRLQIANNSALQVSSSDFTLEAWVYLTVLPASGSLSTIVQKGLTGTSNYEISFRFNNTSGVYTLQLVTTGNGTTLTTSSSSSLSLAVETWYHCAVTKTGTTSTFWFNGVSVGTGTVNSSVITGTANFVIGDNSSGNRPIAGYISNLRLVKGSLVYTSDFTPPTAPLTAITNTSLLTCQSNRFVDNSSNNFSITRNGNTSIQPFSPFAPTSAYSTSVNGGSMYFDGTGDYLSNSSSTAFNFGTGTFTVEYWIYPLAFSGSTGYHQHAGGATSTSTELSFGEQDGYLYATTFTVSNKALASRLALNAWNYVTWTRSGSTLYAFLNGTLLNTFSLSTNVSNSAIGIGASSAGLYNSNSYISNVRVLNGTALYTDTFTPPTAPLTDITNTSLLLNGTNAGIFDNAMKNNLETVGNAQVSTSVTKFGTGSMSFDGNGDLLYKPADVNFDLGTTYTIELWVYPISSTSGFKSLFNIEAANVTQFAALHLGFNDGAAYFEVRPTTSGAITSITGGTVVADTWQHLAISVNAGTGRLYLNGVQVGSTTTIPLMQTRVHVGIGGNGNGFNPSVNTLNGYIDDLRVTKGVARYTSNFTPPSGPYPNS